MGKLLVTIYGIKLENKKTDNLNKHKKINNFNNEINKYDEIPSLFINLSLWPKYCNLECVNCGCITLRRPLFIPVSKTVKGEFCRSNGPIVCSKNCGLTQINIKYREEQREYFIELFNELVYIITGYNLYATPAPERDILQKHGGSMSDKVYQLELYSLNKQMIIAQYANTELLKQESFIN